MKKLVFKTISCFLIFAMLTLSVPFHYGNNEVQAASSPTLTKSTKVLSKGREFTLKIKKSKVQTIQKTKWQTSNKKVASFKITSKTSANIYAKKTGKAKITVTIRYRKKGSNKSLSVKKTCRIQVKSSSANVSDDFMDYDSISTLASKYGFKFGTNINAFSMYNDQFKKLLKHHFNSVTASNEMKAYSLLSQSDSQKSANGMPVMNYFAADSIMDFAKANGIQVRGHTLVWDYDMKDWFFRVGYDSNKSYVDAETAKARLKYYIENVMTHFETKYPGVIYCWDVVNEAVGDSASEYDAGDSRHLRKYRNANDNIFYKIIGDKYVELSFQYAKDTLNTLGSNHIKLFYNDYSTFQPEKRDAICNLVTSINSFEKDSAGNYKKLCDGIGMQSYIGGYGTQTGCMNYNDIELIKQAVTKFAALGAEVHVTEMAVRNYQNDSAAMKKHAQFYEDLFKAYLSLNSGVNKPITSISIWGLCDSPYLPKTDYSYRLNGPYCGLFDQNYRVKESFRKIYYLLKSIS